MKTQLSQFPETLHRPYSGVYQQQGRMITDADWNAGTQVAKDRLDRALMDVIGTGSPEQGGIITGDADAGYQIAWGDVYVDGIRAELMSRTGAAAFDLTDQMDFPHAVAAPEAAHRLYLDVWERSLTALEENTLLDPALHGADTSTRTRTMAQVKMCPPSFDPEDPAQNPPIGEGRLTLSLRASSEAADACEPCLDEIDLSGRVGNYAFRVEIHHVTRDASGAPVGVTLKWSRENGAESAVTGAEPPGFVSADWIYEFYNSAAAESASESHAGFHHPAVLAGGFEEARGALFEGYPDADPAGFDLVRRWDGYIVLERNGATWEQASQLIDGAPVPFGRDRNQRLSPELGEAQHGHVNEGTSVLMSLDTMTLSLELGDHQLLAGDYWIATVREATHIEGAVLRDDATPDGILHHYMCLADVAMDGTLNLLTKDACKRFQFPALTNLHADDVCYDNSACEMEGVGNVQEALDHLCKQKDLKWHNKHLHGWGIVCGLIAECCDPKADNDPKNDEDDPTQCLTISKGYAIDCEGCDIVLDAPLHVDLMDEVRRWDAEPENAPILREGNGTACLSIENQAGQAVVRVEPYQNKDDNFLSQLMDGTLLGDFIQHCILDLIAALTEELSFLEDGKLPTAPGGAELVSQERRKFISFTNLVLQIVFKANGPYVWMSEREHSILKELYDRLRDLLDSKTFCGMFKGNEFPAYEFPGSKIDTWFGADRHARIKADPTGTRIYTFGGNDNVIHVYDPKIGELVEIIEMPVPDGAEITALTCSQDGKLLYVAASVGGTDTILGVAQVGEVHKFERPMQILCDITITEMELARDDPGLIYAVGLGRGLFFLRPAVLAQDDKPAPEPMYRFNAVGHMAVDNTAKRIFCTAADRREGDDGQEIQFISEEYDRIAICEMGASTASDAPAIRLNQIKDGYTTGRDDIAVKEGKLSTIYLVMNPLEKGSDKNIITFDVPPGSVTGISRGILEVQDTTIALAYDQRAEALYASFADSFRMQVIAADGITVMQPRVPVQYGPTDIALGPDGNVYVANFLSSTVTAIPQEEVALSDDRLTRLANMRWRILLAFYALVGNLFQYLKDCFCHHLLLKCPECDGDEKIYIARVDIRAEKGGQPEVYNICNFGKRKYVQTFMGWNYWLSLVPIIPLMKQAIGKMCCSVLPGFLDNFSDNIAPPPKAASYGAASGVATPFKTQSAVNAVSSYKRFDGASFRRQQMGNLSVLGGLAGDIALGTSAQKFLSPNGMRGDALQNAPTEEAVAELKRAGVQAEVVPYDPKLADRYALDYMRTPGRLKHASRVKIYERDGKASLIVEDTRAPVSVQKVTPEEEAKVKAIEDRVAALRAERNLLSDELQELNAGLTEAAELRKNLRVEVDTLRPVKALEGMPAAMVPRLEEAGIRTIGDLAKVSPTTLQKAKIGKDLAARKALIARAKTRLE